MSGEGQDVGRSGLVGATPTHCDSDTWLAIRPDNDGALAASRQSDRFRVLKQEAAAVGIELPTLRPPKAGLRFESSKSGEPRDAVQGWRWRLHADHPSHPR